MDGSRPPPRLDDRPRRLRRPARRPRWRGEARRFGDGAAILIGDLAFVYADLLLAGAPASRRATSSPSCGSRSTSASTSTWSATASPATPSVQQGPTIAVYKSGKYTVERPLHLGAALAGRLDDLAGVRCRRFGIPLGEAFQLRDDLLGAFGDGDADRQAGRARTSARASPRGCWPWAVDGPAGADGPPARRALRPRRPRRRRDRRQLDGADRHRRPGPGRGRDRRARRPRPSPPSPLSPITAEARPARGSWPPS